MLLSTAIVFGFLGSLHCLGMCAPLLWAVPEQAQQRNVWWRNKVMYNLGRAVTYAVLGALFGLIGESFAFAGVQQYLSIFTGVMLLVFLISSKGHIPLSFKFKPINTLFSRLKSKVAFYLKGNTLKSNAMLGLLNGLLPCGLVYMALVASVSMGSISGGATYMFVFGLGTFPMMLAAAFFGKGFKQMKYNWVQNLVPKVVVVVSILLILRGLNLGIPYLSPMLSGGQDMTMCTTP